MARCATDDLQVETASGAVRIGERYQEPVEASRPLRLHTSVDNSSLPGGGDDPRRPTAHMPTATAISRAVTQDYMTHRSANASACSASAMDPMQLSRHAAILGYCSGEGRSGPVDPSPTVLSSTLDSLEVLTGSTRWEYSLGVFTGSTHWKYSLEVRPVVEPLALQIDDDERLARDMHPPASLVLSRHAPLAHPLAP
jgi:hypothetical protein